MPTRAMIDMLAADLEVALTQVVRQFRRLLFDAAEQRGLTQTQYTALRVLADGRVRRMRDLSAYLDLTSGASTAMIERLVERGLVERLEDAADGRAVLVALTPSGTRLVDELVAEARADIAAMLAKLRPAERHMALGGVAALREVLDATLAER